jgi:type I restriction enzyme S subunit
VAAFWDGNIPWVTPADLSDEREVFFSKSCRKITKAGYESCSTELLPPGAVLFSSRAPIGHIAITKHPVCTNQGFKSFVPGPDLSPLFAYFALRFVTPEIIGKGRGATFSEVNTEIMEAVEIPYVDPPRQQILASRLFAAHRLTRVRSHALEMSDGFLGAVFLEMFGDPVINEKGFPRERLEDLIQSARPITYGILKPGPDITDGVPYVRVTDMEDGAVLVHQVRRTSAAIDQEYRRSRLKAGDLLMSIRGHVGRFAVVPVILEGANITQDTARLAPIESLASRYLMGCLESQGMQTLMNKLTRGVAVTGINLGDVKELPIPVPPKALQEKYAATAELGGQLRAVQKEGLRQAEHLFQTLLHEAFGEG